MHELHLLKLYIIICLCKTSPLAVTYKIIIICSTRGRNIEKCLLSLCIPVSLLEELQFTLVFSLLIFNAQESARYDPLNEYTEPNLFITAVNKSKVSPSLPYPPGSSLSVSFSKCFTLSGEYVTVLSSM